MSAPVAAVGGPDQPATAAAPRRPRRVWNRLARIVAIIAVVAGVAGGGYVSRDRWLPVLFPTGEESTDDADDRAEAAGPGERVSLSAQAQKNLRLTSRPLVAETFWKTISVPGMVVNRPGHGDRGVVAPVTGVVTHIHKVAGDDVRPGEALFTLKILSESIHLTQSELFKAAQDIKLAAAQRKRLTASPGAVPEARVVEVDSQITRLEAAVKAYRQELLTRGLPPAQIDGVAEGTFAGEIPIVVPAHPPDPPGTAAAGSPAFEVEEVKVELGQQVTAGQTLCLLADHRLLAVEGRAFRDEAPFLDRALASGWPVGVDFGEEPGHGWDAPGQAFRVTYVANVIDPDSRTFRFLLPLVNQSRAATGGGSPVLWRFRPGQRVRLLVPVEKLDGVFVLPADAVAREGAETYVFRRNGDEFDRRPVHVVYQDRATVVVADDGSVPAGIHVALTGAAQLNRMVKSQAGAAPEGMHVHADGSVHAGKH